MTNISFKELNKTLLPAALKAGAYILAVANPV